MGPNTKFSSLVGMTITHFEVGPRGLIRVFGRKSPLDVSKSIMTVDPDRIYDGDADYFEIDVDN